MANAKTNRRQEAEMETYLYEIFREIVFERNGDIVDVSTAEEMDIDGWDHGLVITMVDGKEFLLPIVRAL